MNEPKTSLQEKQTHQSICGKNPASLDLSKTYGLWQNDKLNLKHHGLGHLIELHTMGHNNTSNESLDTKNNHMNQFYKRHRFTGQSRDVGVSPFSLQESCESKFGGWRVYRKDQGIVTRPKTNCLRTDHCPREPLGVIPWHPASIKGEGNATIVGNLTLNTHIYFIPISPILICVVHHFG